MVGKPKMNDDLQLFHFKWWVPKDKGFQFVEDVELATEIVSKELTAIEKKSPFLVPLANNKWNKSYLPLNESELFIKFARLKKNLKDKQAIIKFANKYGLLGVGIPLVEKGETQVVDGESLDTWKNEIEELFAMYQIWEWLDSLDKNETESKKKLTELRLKKLIVWNDDSTSVSFKHSIGNSKKVEAIASKDYREELFRQFKKGDVIQPAKLLLLSKINKKLRSNASPQILFNNSGDLAPYIYPHNLLAAIWLQLYRATTGQRKFKTCDICKNPMDITGMRVDKVRHDKCYERIKKSRQKTKEAKNGSKKKR